MGVQLYRSTHGEYTCFCVLLYSIQLDITPLGGVHVLKEGVSMYENGGVVLRGPVQLAPLIGTETCPLRYSAERIFRTPESKLAESPGSVCRSRGVSLDSAPNQESAASPSRHPSHGTLSQYYFRGLARYDII